MFRRHAWTIQARMTVLAAGVAALVCVGVSVLVLVGVHGRAADYRQEKAIDAALEVVAQIKQGALPKVLAGGDPPAIQVIDDRGAPVSSTPSLAGKPPISHEQPSQNSVFAARRECPPPGLTGCKVVVAFRVYEERGDWYVYVADEVIPWYTSGQLVSALAAGSLLLVLISAVGAARTVNRSLRPVADMQRHLASITASDSGRRVPVPPQEDEIHALAVTVNETLDRLEAALEHLRRFTSDASHDLRSPITAMRAQLEEALLHPDETDWPEAARAVLASLDRLQALVSDLLMLAKLDANAPGVAAEPVALDRLVVAELERRPRRVRIRLDLAGGAVVRGDVVRLGRLLTNLLDNAERHASTQVRVTVRREGAMAVLEVLDDGAGIAVEQRERVFQRFTRLDAARNRDAGGTGLGLAIARQVAETHGGRLTIEDSPRGARLVLRIPLDQGNPAKGDGVS